MSDLDDLVLRDYDENDTWLMEEHQNTPPAETPKNPNAVALGRLGGRAGRGPSKARTTEQARAAVAVRWNKVKQQKQLNESTL